VILLSKAKCFKCGGSATADTYEQARKLINHAVALGRGIKCGDSYNMVHETTSKEVLKKTPKPEIIKPHISKPETKPDTQKTPSSEKPKEKTKQPKSSI